ncbi:MarR family winged helix-turn-helix transcriptional regulator [Georgenia thermotolerans]|uniref:MarR family transcriptional regulator n=1 Tax=Georgenia thermotolerans TaxID=527326 RepID=A0A7J5UPM2_9MICO|nr:MarR family transcriptional regulator [Georgenia thermotolerans]KAE8764362.1 MarR family transcriptional regulator [Georgenia thermotolerans]
MTAPTTSTTRWLDEDQQHSWRQLLRGSAKLFDDLNRDLEEQSGLSLSEYEVLVRLSEAEGRRMRMSVLADELVHSRSRLTHTIRRMEAAGLVERSSCPDDRRGVNCTLTPAGFARLEAVAPGHVESVRARLVDRISPAQLRQLGEIMATFIEDAPADEA